MAITSCESTPSIEGLPGASPSKLRNPKRSHVIKAFLQAHTHPDLAALYTPEHEVQVNVAKDGGEPWEGDYKGRTLQGFTDGDTVWKPFRIPRNASSAPEGNDCPIKFDLAAHVEGIGCTGWNWARRQSEWFGFDFDALVGHSQHHERRLSEIDLVAVRDQACSIPWVTVRKSTSGRGLHLYVHLAVPVPTANHTEHSALARSILGAMSAAAGFDFFAKIDVAGGNMWIWHRKMVGTDGLSLIRAGIPFDRVPTDWRDRPPVVRPRAVLGQETELDEWLSNQAHVQLDDEHKRLLAWLDEKRAASTWDADRHLLRTHTCWLAKAHAALNLQGPFQTISPGTDLETPNCFAYPAPRGAWAVRRYAPGVAEAATWTQDGGWTRCTLNEAGAGRRDSTAEPSDDGLANFLTNPPPPQPIRVELLPVPKLDERLIPEPLRAWLVDIAERASCPLDLPAVGALISLATVVGRKVAIRPKRQDDWTVVPNLWGFGVLPPGHLKSHCLEEPKKPLARLELEARARHEQAVQAFAVSEAVAVAQAEAAKGAMKAAAKRSKGGKAVPDETLRALAAESLARPELVSPVLRRYVVNDATVEKLGELLKENPNGLLQFRDELMGFLRILDKDGHENDRAFYLEAWNGTGSYSYDRIGRGSLFIPSNTVSVLGGIQPGRLAAYIRSRGSGEDDDGFISRFQLAVYPDTGQPYEHVDRWPDAPAKELAWGVFQRLDALDPVSFGARIDADDAKKIPYLRFAEDAQKYFDEWRTDLENRVRSSGEQACLIGHLAKYRSLMPSLALLFHLANGTPGPVSLPSAELAIAWCDYLEHHARRIYRLAFDGDPEPARRLAERIKSSLPNPFSVRQVVKKGWATLGTTEEVERAVATLEEHGWVYCHESPPGPQGGRPKVAIHVNPLAQGGE